jgi:3-hydroxybutyryl-CoA dehydratase
MNEYTFETLYPGLEESFDVEITEEMMLFFRRFTGDTSLLHTDIQYAKSKGYERELVYGVLTSSFYSTLLGVYLPGKYNLSQEYHISFNAPVYVGDKLMVSGVVKEINDTLKRVVIKAKIRKREFITGGGAISIEGYIGNWFSVTAVHYRTVSIL